MRRVPAGHAPGIFFDRNAPPPHPPNTTPSAIHDFPALGNPERHGSIPLLFPVMPLLPPGAASHPITSQWQPLGNVWETTSLPFWHGSAVFSPCSLAPPQLPNSPHHPDQTPPPQFPSLPARAPSGPSMTLHDPRYSSRALHKPILNCPQAPPLALHKPSQGGPQQGKKSVPLHSFPKKAHGHAMCWRWAVGGWRLATGSWWRLVVVGGGWWLGIGG